jgi:multiple sugar transport system permease protein
MIFPIFFGIILFYFWPLVQTFYLSFTDWGAFGQYKWSGLENYTKLLNEPDLIKSLKNTIVFTCLSVPLGIMISTGISLLLNQKIKGLGLYRTLYFLPVVTMPVAIAILWKWLYNADYGLINYFLGKIGIDGPRWITDPSLALYSIILVAVWSSLGYNIIIILAGLQGISRTYYEAASLDGAGTWYKFKSITLPLLTPTLFFVTVTSLISSLQVFELIYMMIGQGSMVIESTQTLVYLFYNESFISNDKGYAAAIAVLLFFIILSATMLQFYFQKKWVHYE